MRTIRNILAAPFVLLAHILTVAGSTSALLANLIVRGIPVQCTVCGHQGWLHEKVENKPCSCDPATVRPQEYQRAVPILVPNFIELRKNDPEQTRREIVCIDACLVSEIWELWRQGIRTTGSCCGHNQGPAYIGVVDEDIPKMKALGYKVAPNPCDARREDSFVPKSLKQL